MRTTSLGPALTPRTVTPADAAAVRTVLARALADDPLMRWLFPDASDRASSVALWLTPFVDRYAALGRGRVVVGDDGGVVAAALWRWPDDDLAAPPAGGLLPDPLAVQLVLLGPDRSAVFRTGMAAARDAAPPLHGAYLHLLGVDPAHHRRGLGRTLVDDGARTARADGLGVHLATFAQANLAFYQACGLAVLAEARVADDGPTVWQVGTPDAVVAREACPARPA